jgi:hypothetical protein
VQYTTPAPSPYDIFTCSTTPALSTPVCSNGSPPPPPTPAPLPANQAWNISFGNQFIGGDATLTYSYDGTSNTSIPFSFNICGDNGNPTATAIQSQLTSGPWYMYQIGEWESGLLQFCVVPNRWCKSPEVPYGPIFGSPQGFGIMQLDTPPDSIQITNLTLFDWVQNVSDGVTTGTMYQTDGTDNWNKNWRAYRQYVKANPNTAPSPPAPDSESNCGTFVCIVPGGQPFTRGGITCGTSPASGEHSFGDANGIKRYNGGWYIAWQGTATTPQWKITPGKNNYVANACSESAP